LSDEHRIATLDNGVRVVTERVPGVRSVALGFWIAAGSVVEEESQAGISHLLEHMLFRGSERFGSEEIDQIFDAMGAEINAGTDKEATSLYTRVLDRHLERAFEVMSDMIWHPRFGELEAEREVVLEEIAMYEDDPQDRVFDALGRAIFGAHPLGRPVIGSAGVVGAVTREQLAAFHAEHYLPARIVIGTSLVMILAVSAATTMVHALTTRAVDVVLAALLLVGGVIGAQYGALLTLRVKPDMLRLALSIIILLVGLRMFLGLFWHPDEIFSIEYL